MKKMLMSMVIIAALSMVATAQVTVSTLTESFDGSGGVAVGEDGNIYVGDFGIALNNANGSTIKRIDPATGDVTVFANGFFGASGNDWGADGFFYQSNIAGNRVSKVSQAGVVTVLANGVTGPVGCVVAPNGDVFATNCATPGAIDRITPNGTVTQFVQSSLLACPNGLTMDDDGNLYTCNFSNGWVVKITPQGQASNFASIPGNNNGHLTFANDRLYVVARCANQIYEVSLTGQVSWLAGSGTRGNADGSAAQATFSVPNGIRASRTGDTLFVNDAVDLTGGCFGGPLNPVVIRMITGLLVGIDDRPIDGPRPDSFELIQNYPNPFNPQTTIRFDLARSGEVNLRVFDLSGREVRTLIAGHRSAGSYEVDFDGSDLASGVYLYRLESGKFTQTRKMTLMK